MSDIVEQLLVDADWFGAENARKAATEIKRLRAEVEQWKERYEAERRRSTRNDPALRPERDRARGRRAADAEISRPARWR
jgi:hypothetical protein